MKSLLLLSLIILLGACGSQLQDSSVPITIQETDSLGNTKEVTVMALPLPDSISKVFNKREVDALLQSNNFDSLYMVIGNRVDQNLIVYKDSDNEDYWVFDTNNVFLPVDILE